MILIYHNPRCGKSRACLTYLTELKQDFEIINYLVQVPTFEEMQSIIKKLNYKPIELIRQKEKIWIEQYKNKNLTDSEIIQAMISNPILIERPILIHGNCAVVARALEKICEIIE